MAALNLKFISVLVALLILSACSTAPTKVQKKQADKPKVAPAVVKETLATLQQQIANSSGLTRRHMQIRAIKMAMQQNKPQAYIMAIVEAIDDSLIGTLDDDFQLASIYLQFDMFEQAQNIVIRLQQGALPRAYQVPLWILAAQAASSQDQHLHTTRTLFRIQTLYSERLTAQNNKLINKLLWKHINKVSLPTLNQFKQDFGPSAASWVELSTIVRQQLSDPKRLSLSLQNWLAHFSKQQSIELLPEQIQQLVTIKAYPQQRLAILLPFSGSLANQAKAIRDGFLTNQVNELQEFIFIDTDKMSMDNIAVRLAEEKVEFVVGPLRKNVIEQYQQHENLQQYPSLFLNQPEQLVENPQHFYYPLAPEDEINQAVQYFIDKDIKHPTLIYADNSFGRRLAEQFNDQWLMTTEQEVESIPYNNTAKLGEAVTNLLDVSVSEERIKQMRLMFGKNIKTETRSRNDIDAVYIIANSQQTRLIKPFFDVNLSTFGQRLPIYGSSRSYLIGESRAQKRDLNGLIFTEMPWLTTNTNNQAQRIYQQIGQPQTQLKRLFAFGYDAHTLLAILQQLSILKEQSIEGLTGQLSMSERNVIKRSLNWSQYRQGKIVAYSTTKQ